MNTLKKGVCKRGNSYRITVCAGYDAKGKQIRLTKTYVPPEGASRAQINYEIEKISSEMTPESITRERMTLNTLYELWKDTVAEEDLELGTLIDTTARIEKVILPALGRYKLSDLSPMIIHDFLKGLRNAKRKDGRTGYAEATITRLRVMLSAVLEFGVQYGYMTSNPCHAIRMKHKETPGEKIKVFTPEQTKKFFELLDTPIPIVLEERHVIRNGKEVTLKACNTNKTFKVALKYKLFYYIAVFSGLRRGEIISLTWDDLDMNEGVIRVNKATARCGSGQYIKAPKTSNGRREVCVPLLVMDLAKELKKEQEEYIESVGSHWVGPKGSQAFLFVQEDGSQMGVATPYNEFKRIVRAYNKTVTEEADKLPEIPLHGLRHTSASLAKLGGIDTYALSKRLGHADITTTLNIYVDMYKETDRKGVEAILRGLGY